MIEKSDRPDVRGRRGGRGTRQTDTIKGGRRRCLLVFVRPNFVVGVKTYSLRNIQIIPRDESQRVPGLVPKAVRPEKDSPRPLLSQRFG